MTTLTEFLLARIAEDEAVSWTLEPYACPPGHCAPAGWVGSRCHICANGVVYGGTVEAMTASAEEHAEQYHQRTRVLAECEAKRRIVDRALTLGEQADAMPGNGTLHASFEGQAVAWRVALRFLALPYADHPDYREGWRP